MAKRDHLLLATVFGSFEALLVRLDLVEYHLRGCCFGRFLPEYVNPLV